MKNAAKWIIAALGGLGALLVLVLTLGRWRIGPFAKGLLETAQRGTERARDRADRTKAEAFARANKSVASRALDLDREAGAAASSSDLGATLRELGRKR